MVCDVSVSGLYELVWVPRFPLPTIHTHARAVEEGTDMTDDADLQALCWVDITHYVENVDEFKRGGVVSLEMTSHRLALLPLPIHSGNADC
jgi:hypothetical protein